MNTAIQLFRLELDGRWSAEDLGQAMISISDLYDLRLFLELLRDDHREWERFYDELMHFPPFRHRWKRRMSSLGGMPWAAGFGGALPPPLDDAQLSRLSRLLEPEERLEVRRITYASPGTSDLA
ncbi:MAG: hypothetical protein AABZ01_05940, partial [Gemmatimonadota bacterium]